jgi:hypothetical protein
MRPMADSRCEPSSGPSPSTVQTVSRTRRPSADGFGVRAGRLSGPGRKGGGTAALAGPQSRTSDGNKRLALAGVIAFYGLNGRRLTLTNDQAYDLVMAVADGSLEAVEDILPILVIVRFFRDRSLSRKRQQALPFQGQPPAYGQPPGNDQSPGQL